MNATALELRHDRGALVHELEGAGASFKGAATRCPFHEDKTASGAIYEDAAGVWRFKCHAQNCGFGGDVFDVKARVAGAPLREVLPKGAADPAHAGAKRPAPQGHGEAPTPKASAKAIGKTLDEAVAAAVRITGGRLEARYSYVHPDTGHARFHVLRLRMPEGSKSFRPLTETREGYILEAPPKPWPLYRRDAIRESGFIVIVEGEKAADSLNAVNVPATTSAGGAGKAAQSDWTPLAGKEVYLWPDADPPDPKTGKRTGCEHMREVAGIVGALDPPARLYWIDPDALGLPPKGDAFDFVARLTGDAQAKRAAVEDMLDAAEPMGASAEVGALIEETIAGRRRAIPWPWPCLSRLTRALLPGTVTILCGDPGATKTLMLLEALAEWHREGVKVAVYELEDGRDYHLLRVLAQTEGNSNFTDPDFVERNPHVARDAHEQHRDFLDGFGRRLWDAPLKQLTHTNLLGWIRERAKEGCRIVAVDPVTAVEASAEPWIADGRFLIEAKRIVLDAGASLILVTHPRKGRKSAIGFDELAGGAAYARFSQTILWVEHHRDAKAMRVSQSVGAFDALVNRTVHLVKTRNAAGQGLALGFHFDGARLRMQEQGVIVR